MAIIQLSEKLSDLPAMPDFSNSEWKTLKKGKFVKRHEKISDENGHATGKGIAYMILDHPPQKVWNQILDFDHYSKFFPNVSKCKIYNQEENEIFAEFKLTIALFIKIHYHIHHTFFPKQSRMTWKADQTKKNDFKESIGMWTAWPYENGKSLVCYTVSIESGRPVPKIVEDLAAQSGLIKVMSALKNRVR